MNQELRGSEGNPYHVSCGGVIVREKDGQKEVLLLYRLKKKGWDFDSWHLPKGTKRKDESFEESARREVLEETGYEVEVIKKLGILKSHYEIKGQRINKKTHYFLCKSLRRVHKDIKEHDGVEWVEIGEAIKKLAKFPLFETEDRTLEKI